MLALLPEKVQSVVLPASKAIVKFPEAPSRRSPTKTERVYKVPGRTVKPVSVWEMVPSLVKPMVVPPGIEENSVEFGAQEPATPLVFQLGMGPKL